MGIFSFFGSKESSKKQESANHELGEVPLTSVSGSPNIDKGNVKDFKSNIIEKKDILETGRESWDLLKSKVFPSGVPEKRNIVLGSSKFEATLYDHGSYIRAVWSENGKAIQEKVLRNTEEIMESIENL